MPHDLLDLFKQLPKDEIARLLPLMGFNLEQRDHISELLEREKELQATLRAIFKEAEALQGKLGSNHPVSMRLNDDAQEYLYHLNATSLTIRKR